MGLMDKVKAQATVLAQKTQETAREGMARLDQATAQRHADGLLRNLEGESSRIESAGWRSLQERAT